MKETEKHIGEPVRRGGGNPLAARLVENNDCNLLGKSSWFALAALAGSLLRLCRRPPARKAHRGRRHEVSMRSAWGQHASSMPAACYQHEVGMRSACRRHEVQGRAARPTARQAGKGGAS